MLEKSPEKPAVREPAPEPTLREDIVVRASPVRCPYCHDELSVERAAWVVCRSCLARHHEGCWRESKTCASCGHALALSGEPLEGRTTAAWWRPFRSKWMPLVMLLAPVVGGVASMIALRPKPVPPVAIQAPSFAVARVIPLDELDARLEEARFPIVTTAETRAAEGWQHLDPGEGVATAIREWTLDGDRLRVQLAPGAVVKLGAIEQRLDHAFLSRSQPVRGHFRLTFSGARGSADRVRALESKLQELLGGTWERTSWSSTSDEVQVTLRLTGAPGHRFDRFETPFAGEDPFFLTDTELLGDCESIAYHLTAEGKPADGGRALAGLVLGTLSGDGALEIEVARGRPVSLASLDAALAPGRVDRGSKIAGVLRVRTTKTTDVDRLRQALARAGGREVGSMTYSEIPKAEVTFFVPKSAHATLGRIEGAFEGLDATFELLGEVDNR
jgi:hypothetical protein